MSEVSYKDLLYALVYTFDFLESPPQTGQGPPFTITLQVSSFDYCLSLKINIYLSINPGLLSCFTYYSYLYIQHHLPTPIESKGCYTGYLCLPLFHFLLLLYSSSFVGDILYVNDFACIHINNFITCMPVNTSV